MLPEPETVASQVLDVTGQHRPPTDVRAILRKWSQLSVVETDLDGDGFFIDLGEVGGEIFVKKDKSESRKRFTLAHELGHYLLLSHIRMKVEKKEMENWCNRFASELLVPKTMLSQHLKSGGMKRLTDRICEGPNVFGVSEQAFCLRAVRLFPLSILHVLLSDSKMAVVDEFRSQKLEEYLGVAEPILDSQIQAFISDLAEAETEQQRQLKQFDRTWLVRRIYRNASMKKFLLVLLQR